MEILHLEILILSSEEWSELFGDRIDLERLEKICLSGRLRGSRLRGIIWKVGLFFHSQLSLTVAHEIAVILKIYY